MEWDASEDNEETTRIQFRDALGHLQPGDDPQQKLPAILAGMGWPQQKIHLMMQMFALRKYLHNRMPPKEADAMINEIVAACSETEGFADSLDDEKFDEIFKRAVDHRRFRHLMQ
jgi:hypothetical protein